MFKKFIAASMLMVAMVAGQAATIGTENLTEAQIAEIKAKVAEVAAQNANKVGKKVEPAAITAGVALAASWGTQAAAAAEGFAKALGIAARELNVSINEFLASDAGKLTAVLIIWHVAGKSIIGLIYAAIVLAVGLGFVRFMYNRLFTSGTKTVPYSRFWGLWSGEKVVRVRKSFSDLNNEGEWFVFLLMLAVGALTLLVAGIAI